MLDFPPEHTVNVNIQFPVTIPVMDGVSNNRIAFMLEDFLRDYSDGRYPFTVEQLKAALHGCVRHAIYQVISEREEQAHRGEYIEYESPDGKVSCRTAKHVSTTEKAMRKVHPYVREEISVSVSERPERRPGATRR